ncbi:FAD-binding oxidoreductase [Magnetospirillum aberrantis]|uniref:2Fe-2S iron-sulfur cluster binding domain-containing protein n=1 Tax=Magnetospirillum aberrantis SpK TaxID=908842 RepID=A0A7C9QUY3_9PROT|nr:FAD-binding oxidoreductase [Magnetospirillum aberrantis]NFV81017.1 2Fe-2S iron-sulfur cluster binding domain-containing protein [Magnetospirillum aberrantis SpK]
MRSSAVAERFAFRVVEKQKVSPSVVRLALAPEEGRAMPYDEGQFLSIQLPDGQARCYSMARAWDADGTVELHVRIHPGGLFSDRTLTKLDHGAAVAALGPFGGCVWVPWDGPTLMLAVGTGIAPLNAIVERLARSGHAAPVHLYWGVRTTDDLYLADHLRDLAEQLPWFHFVPVLEQPPAGSAYRQGFVQDQAARDFPSLADAQVYACGVPVMVEAARHLFVGSHGLPADRFHADPFSPPQEEEAATTAVAPLTVTAIDGDGNAHTLAASSGTSLLAVLRAAHMPLLSVCGGKKSCGTCRVAIAPEHFPRLPKADADEARLLAALDDPADNHRLACQVLLSPALDGLRVVLPREIP